MVLKCDAGKGQSHTGCLLNECTDDIAELGRQAEGSEICPGPQKYGSFWLRVRPTTREFAEKCDKTLPTLIAYTLLRVSVQSLEKLKR